MESNQPKDFSDLIQELVLINNLSGSLIASFVFAILSEGSFIGNAMGSFISFGLLSLIFCLPSVGILYLTLTKLEKADLSPTQKTIYTILPQIIYLLLILTFVISFEGEASIIGKAILFFSFSVPFIGWFWKSNPWQINPKREQNILDDF